MQQHGPPTSTLTGHFIKITDAIALQAYRILRPFHCFAFSYDADKPPLLLISIDGFHPDYLAANRTPVMQRLHDCGTHAPYMRSVYPTLTFPNHYTMVTVSAHFLTDHPHFHFRVPRKCFLGVPPRNELLDTNLNAVPMQGVTMHKAVVLTCCFIVQGLYPESHSIVDNNMYDSNSSEYFRMGSDSTLDNHWWGGEPVSMNSRSN